MDKPKLKPRDLSFPTVLGKDDDTRKFFCGNKDIDDFIQRQALVYQENRLGVTYLFKHEEKTVGFATLSMAHLNKQKMQV